MSLHTAPSATIYALPNNTAISDALNDFVTKASKEAIARSNRFTVALSGGSLPSILAEKLKSNTQVDFSKWHVFFADERCVPLDHADSNYLLCKKALFDHVPIPKDQIYHIAPEFATDPPAAAAEYEQQLRRVFGTDYTPVFDLLFLGMGPDGHTCSLFPGHKLLEEHSRWVSYLTDSPKPPPPRITLTFPVLNKAHAVAFVSTGESKADVVKRIFDLGEPFPSAMVQPTSKNLVWFVDTKAAKDLKKIAVLTTYKM
ncbi:6-phosphogluconolactonase [Quaeritorhiza haematococci]|nr:6-phosphogluconolactonase [Quaeritorhiza haematococci]